jgi:hypothetical protein
MYSAAARGSTVPVTDRLVALYPALLDAGDRADAPALAAVGWELFEIASMAEQAHHEAAAQADELRLASRVVVAGHGSPASVALLRAVIARYGWLPTAGATPLQVLAAPSRS